MAELQLDTKIISMESEELVHMKSHQQSYGLHSGTLNLRKALKPPILSAPIIRMKGSLLALLDNA